MWDRKFQSLHIIDYLTMDEVVWSKKGPNAASSYTVHGARLQVHQ